MINQTLLNTIELQAERVSKELIELLSSLSTKEHEATECTLESSNLYAETIEMLCKHVEGNIDETALLIHSLEEIFLDMDSVDRLVHQVQAIKQLLNAYE